MSAGVNVSDFIVSNATGEELGYIHKNIDIDMDLGDTNDFEIQMDIVSWDKIKYWYGNRIFIPGTEYGGLIEDVEVLTKSNRILLRGHTWRGLLTQKVVEPPTGSDHLTLNGDLNTVIGNLIADRFGSLFSVSNINSGITLNNWQVDRYVTLYDAIMKLLDAEKCRLQIAYVEPDGLEYGYVKLQAVQITDYSSKLEYSQESKVYMDVRDYRKGINHLVCAGTGQNEERIVLHLYTQKDGSIGKTQYYYGLDERAAVYDFSSADAAKLEEDGTKRLKDLQNYKSIDVTVDDIDIEIGDIIGGYEQITGTTIKSPVIGKILNTRNRKATISYKIKGDD